MSSTCSIETVIKKLASVEKLSSSSQKLVAVELKSKEVKKILPGGIVLGGKPTFYLVSNNTDRSNLAECENIEAEVKDFAGNRSIGLRVAYQASCNPGNEEILAISLCSEFPPEYELHKKIKSWVSAFTKGEAGAQFVDCFLTEIPKLEAHLKQEAQSIGLNLEEVRVTTDRNPTYYLITNAKDSANIAQRENLNILFSDVSNAREIGLMVSYQAGFFKEDQSKVIEALSGNTSILETIDRKLKEWTERFIETKGRANFITNYSEELPKLQQALEKKAREEAGLRLSVRVALDRNPIRYIISTIADPANIVDRTNLKVSVADVRGNRRANLLINYRAGYDPRDEDILSRAFESSKSIGEEIDTRIKGWIYAYLNNDEAGFIDRYSILEVESLTRSIQDEARKIGLKLDLRISLDRETELKLFHFGSKKTPIEIPVYTRGCEDELTLRVWLKLAVDQSRLINAVLRSLPVEEMRIFSAIKAEIVTFFREQISIKEFCYELKGNVRDRLLVRLNQFLEPYGRTAEDFFLDSDTYFPNGRTIEIGTKQNPAKLQVHLKDCDDELELLLHTALTLDEDNLSRGAAYALPSKESFLRATVEKLIKEFLNSETRLQDFSSSLKGKVRDELFAYLNEILPRRYGYRVQFLNLAGNLEFLPRDIIEIEYTFQCKVGSFDAVPIENTVQMLPVNLAKYKQMLPYTGLSKNAQNSPLEDWVKDKLETIIKPLLLEKQYADLLSEEKLKKISDDIKEKMEQEASSIGFSIKHVVSVPDLPHRELKKEFSLLQERGYLTNDTSVEIKLNTRVVARFDTFDGAIKDYLGQSVKEIKEKLQDAIAEAAGNCLAEADPARYYSKRFYQADGKQGDDQSIEKQLKDAIESALLKYGATVITVTVRPVDTPISLLFKELSGKVENFEFTINSLTGGESVRFQGRFQVEGVADDCWNIFYNRMGLMQRSKEPRHQELQRLQNVHARLLQAGDLEEMEELQAIRQQMEAIKREISGIEDIKDSIVSSVEQMLSAYDSTASTYVDLANLGALQKEINKWAGKSVEDEYGLTISIRNLRRNRTECEERLFKVQNTLRLEPIEDAEIASQAAGIKRETQRKMTEAKYNSRLTELEKLRDKRAKLSLHYDENKEEIEQLDHQISLLENEIDTPSLSGSVEALRALELKPTPKAKNFLEAQKDVSSTTDDHSTINTPPTENQS